MVAAEPADLALHATFSCAPSIPGVVKIESNK